MKSILLLNRRVIQHIFGKYLLTGALMLIVVLAAIPKQAEAQHARVSFQIFYNRLSPYGKWTKYANFGFVWVPNAGPDFVPYFTNGHWVYTDYGWTWVSDYDWGWAPFHYGRWDYDDTLGWFWIPGDTWAPAWVAWVQSGGYYGWAPLGPGISLSVALGPSYINRNRHWIFVRDRDIYRHDISRYRARDVDRNRLINRARIINHVRVDRNRNSRYMTGPRREDVRRATNRKVNPMRVKNRNNPGSNIQNRQLHIYRPRVQNPQNMRQRPAPPHVTKPQNIKPPSQRTRQHNPGRRSSGGSKRGGGGRQH